MKRERCWYGMLRRKSVSREPRAVRWQRLTAPHVADADRQVFWSQRICHLEVAGFLKKVFGRGIITREVEKCL